MQADVPPGAAFQLIVVAAWWRAGRISRTSAFHLYDAKANCLRADAKGDLRKLAGKQDFVATTPLNLVYVADLSKLKDVAPEDQTLYAGADTGFMVQNVYLFCASEGLATAVRASLDRKELAAALKLPAQKRITLVQTVGYVQCVHPNR
jgi:nitroreductase